MSGTSILHHGTSRCHSKRWRRSIQVKGLGKIPSSPNKEHSITHPHLPSAHGIVERVNKETLKQLRILLNGHVHLQYDDWQDILPLVEHRPYNGAINTTPATLMFGSKGVHGVYDRKLDSGNNIDLSKDTDTYLRLLDDQFRHIRDLSITYQDTNAVQNLKSSMKSVVLVFYVTW